LPAEPVAARRLALSEDELRTVRDIVGAVLPGVEVWGFGSRATGSARPFSDLDLLFGRRLSLEERAELRDRFEASTLPFIVDLVEREALSPGMRERIDSECVIL
jgi:predicted nucleotidyltransferase